VCTASDVNTDRQTDRQTTDVRYKDHTKKRNSSHTNLMMAEHSTNAKFYTHFKVPMTLYVSKLHESLVEISQSQSSLKKLVSSNFM